jgi:hypothetical protein
MSDNIITFLDRSQSKKGRAERPPVPEYNEGCSTGYAYARRNRMSPRRQMLRRAEIAVVQLNKVDYQHTDEELEYIRKGVEAVKALAEDIASAAEKVLTRPRRTSSEAASVVTTLPDAEQQMLEAIVERLLKERGL